MYVYADVYAIFIANRHFALSRKNNEKKFLERDRI